MSEPYLGVEDGLVLLGEVEHEAKVSQFAESVAADEDVLRLDVHVDELVVVQVLEGVQQVDQVGPHRPFGNVVLPFGQLEIV